MRAGWHISLIYIPSPLGSAHNKISPSQPRVITVNKANVSAALVAIYIVGDEPAIITSTTILSHLRACWRCANTLSNHYSKAATLRAASEDYDGVRTPIAAGLSAGACLNDSFSGGLMALASSPVSDAFPRSSRV